MKRHTETVVYFIQCGDAGPIKIGLTTDVEGRLENLQAANPVRLVLVAVVPGDWHLEQSLHARFAAGRIQGEWFAVDTPGLGELLAYVFEHGEMPPERFIDGDPTQRGCASCGWQMEPELVERGEDRCWRCLKDASQPKSPANPKPEERDPA